VCCSTLCGLFRRKPVDAGGDGGKRDAAGPKLVSYLQAATVAGGEDAAFAMTAAFPDWPDRVDDVAHRRVKVKCGRRYRVARLAWPDRCARYGQPRPGRSVDRPVYSTAA